MKKNLPTFFAVVIFILWYFPVAIPYGQPSIGYSTAPDTDADYLISQRVARGEKLYESFSILYPPGRFLIQGFLFRLMAPSFVILSAFHAAMSHVLFPAVLFLLTFFLFETLLRQQLLKKHVKLTKPLALFFALIAPVLYLLFIRSAQEIHVISALFFTLLLLPGKTTSLRKIVLGVLLGLAFLFRMDGGILLLLALVVSTPRQILSNRPKLILYSKHLIVGFILVWLPTLLLIIFHGSLFNFLYDSIMLGLVIQPRFMSLPIPENELGLVWVSSMIFLLASSTALFADAAVLKEKFFAVRSVALFGLLSFVSGLGRSDEAHLWYGLVWLPIFMLYAGYRVVIGVIHKERIFRKLTLISAVIFYFFTKLIIAIKSPIFFLILTAFTFLLVKKRTFPVSSLLIGGSLAAVLIFHSVSYIKLRYEPLRLPPSLPFSHSWITSEGTEFGGMQMFPQDEEVLKKIRADIPTGEKNLFIFPKNVLLNEYLKMEYPTRYIILANERSEYTEREVIHDLEKTNTRYFLIFTDAAKLREGQVWDWILANTKPVSEYDFGEEEAELRQKN